MAEANVVEEKQSATVTDLEGARKVKAPKRKFWQRQDKRFKIRPKLPSSFRLSKMTLQFLAKNWKVIGGILLIYGVLNIVLVRGLDGGANIGQLKSGTDNLFHGGIGHIASGLTIFGILLTSSNSAASAASGVYQTMLLLIVSLALVWSYRQLLAGHVIRIRDGFYSGMYPLIPVLIVLAAIGLELLPALIGSWLYGVFIQDGIATTSFEQLLSLVILIGLACWSVYLICSTVFALYIVSLPNMTPRKAMLSARELVRYRRWPILRKFLLLLLILLVAGAIIMLPFILLVPALAQWIFFVLTVVAIALAHAFSYMLYRELLNE